MPPAVKVPETREEKELAMQREREEKSRHENGEWDPLESNFDRDLLRLFNEVSRTVAGATSGSVTNMVP